MTDDTCIFCRIVAGEVPAQVVAQTETLVAFEDIAPIAETHVLVIPRTHYRDVVDLAAHEPAALPAMVALAEQIAAERCGGAFRFLFNTGAAAGQTVFHAHAHVLGGAVNVAALATD